MSIGILETVPPIPPMHAWPPMTAVYWVMRSKGLMVPMYYFGCDCAMA
jgi:hypothetical protein